MPIPIKIDVLLKENIIEHERLELKKGFNPIEIMHTMCAFANDFNNWGGGYLIIGIDNDTKEVVGVEKSKIDFILKKLIELSNKIIYPYFPIMDVVEYKSKFLIVLYCYGGPSRPYKCPESLGKKPRYIYYIRRGASTVIAKPDEERELISMSQNIPFDDRINLKAELSDLDLNLISSFLKETNSNLDINKLKPIEIYKSLNIIDGPNEYIKPKNIGLLLFSREPKKYIKTPWIEVTVFHDKIGDNFEEKIFSGDVISQIRGALQFIKNNVIIEKVRKVPNKAESLRFYSYPFVAIEEALVNAVYHKDYEIDAPIEVRVELDKTYITSYPGPMPPLNKNNINDDVVISRRYRNRRIGDFLKELHFTEGRNTGFKKIRDSLRINGSPKPVFITDDERCQFITKFEIHPEFKKKIKDISLVVQAGVQVGVQVSFIDIDLKIIKFINNKNLVAIKYILNYLGYKSRTRNFRTSLKKLLDFGFIEMNNPNSPRDPNQRYKITLKGKNYIEGN